MEDLQSAIREAIENEREEHVLQFCWYKIKNNFLNKVIIQKKQSEH